MLDTKELFTDNETYKIREKENNKYVNNYSLSKIQTFNRCPLQGFFQYCTDYKIKNTVWPATLFGETLHHVIEQVILQKNEGKTYKEIMKSVEADEMFKTYFDDKLIQYKEYFKKSKDYTYPKYLKKGETYTKVLSKFVFKTFEDTIAIPEKSYKVPFFKYKDTQISLNGKVDLQVIKNDKIYIYDFKTTKHNDKFFFVDWSNDKQSNIYHYLAEHDAENKDNLKVRSFGFIVLNHQDFMLFTKEGIFSKEFKAVDHVESMENMKEDIKEIHDFVYDMEITPSIEKKISKVSPNDCYWCSRNGICPHRKKVNPFAK